LLLEKHAVVSTMPDGGFDACSVVEILGGSFNVDKSWENYNKWSGFIGDNAAEARSAGWI